MTELSLLEKETIERVESTSIDELREDEKREREGLCLNKSHATSSTPRHQCAMCASLPAHHCCTKRHQRACTHPALYACVSSCQAFVSAGLSDSCGRKPAWNKCGCWGPTSLQPRRVKVNGYGWAMDNSEDVSFTVSTGNQQDRESDLNVHWTACLGTNLAVSLE